MNCTWLISVVPWAASAAITSAAPARRSGACTGAPVQAPDLRAGAALVIAALAAHGTTEISHVQYIERGYEDIVGKLRAVGADISMVDEPETEKDEARIG